MDEDKTLLRDVKEYLDITFSDDATDKKLTGVILRGTSYLDGVAGTPQDYKEESLARQLLFDYCRYANANCLEDFQKNFGQDLLTLRIQNGVDDYAAV